ncbi:hypothetical protein [Sanguibacter massiliensis]|uniref:hypothetical protein n=1 Tax=Sanguibacter massiliensis TaxID=1973217 RepID=UPI0013ECC15D|nr:hypothetical protein [Sanguibacter massiliensis]
MVETLSISRIGIFGQKCWAVSALLAKFAVRDPREIASAVTSKFERERALKSFSRTLTTCVASAALLVASAGLAQAAEPQVGHHDSSTVEGALRTLAQSPEVLSQVTWL